MSGRCSRDSTGNGPVKLDEGRKITACTDCSHKECELRRKSRWPATTIAKGCPLPGAEEEHG